jgi:hypothetical protein
VEVAERVGLKRNECLQSLFEYNSTILSNQGEEPEELAQGIEIESHTRKITLQRRGG